uniref:Uncharacterized protein n=1 Tax=Cacopsylla melanoneura TaxID=428564 RepID=A0A8D8YRY5_9HEMI
MQSVLILEKVLLIVVSLNLNLGPLHVTDILLIIVILVQIETLPVGLLIHLNRIHTNLVVQGHQTENNRNLPKRSPHQNMLNVRNTSLQNVRNPLNIDLRNINHQTPLVRNVQNVLNLLKTKHY